MPSELLLIQAPILCALFFVLLVFDPRRKNGGTPTVRCWPSIFPEFLDRLSYNANAVGFVQKGYRMYKDRPFRLLRLDMDLVVIPLKYAAELRAVTSDKLDPLTASFNDNSGELTGILLGSELHSDAIHRRLTPGLPRIIPVVLEELKFAFDHILPWSDGDIGSWIPMNPYDMVLDLSTRAAARVFVGEPICRDEVFLQASASYSRNTFSTIATFRNLGSLASFLFRRTVSSVADAREQLVHVQQLLGSEVERRRASPDEKHDDFLQWCMDLARTEDESKPEAIAHRTLGILGMAVVHTTAMATTHMLFDLMADPGLHKALRQEQKDILTTGCDGINQKAMLEMRRLDSLMRESQRFNPVGEFTFRRVVRQPITLSDGYKLHPGQQIGVPARNINVDESVMSVTAAFNPTRWAQEKQTSALFAHSSATNLHFGLGRYACPGRFFASHMIKAIVSRLLLDYEFKFQDGREHNRPPNIISGDKILPNRDATVLFRHRHNK